MKKIIMLTLLIFLLSVTASAKYLHDNEGLLSSEEAQEVEKLLEKASDKANFPVIVVTSSDYGYSIEAFAEECVSEYEDAAVLVASAYYDEWYLHTVGRADEIYDIDDMLDEIMPHRQAFDYPTAFKTFADYCYKEASVPASRILIPVVIGVIIGLITVGVMKSGLKSVRYKSGAEDYIKRGSLNVTTSRDTFLWRNVTRVRRQSNNNSSTRSSGGGVSRGSGRKF